MRVRTMFDRIARTYSLVNTLTSAGRDRAWRRELVRMANVQPGDRLLDLGCGTGDLTAEFHRCGLSQMVGLDFARLMLEQAASRPTVPATWCQGDALRLPFVDASFDLISCAFSVRNFQNLTAGLQEMYRVLRPGGRLLILEFAMPEQRMIRQLYQFYFTRILPRLATWISHDTSGAYRYLPSSVLSFDHPQQLITQMNQCGFEQLITRRRSFGIVYLFRGLKRSTPAEI
ncbi:MAG: Demethylmenaquinone methyltransferase [Phycisphaerae bacterium]|nr:Demethylmenaquinone methyltransferase [Phycisphaerae bacterium]